MPDKDSIKIIPHKQISEAVMLSEFAAQRGFKIDDDILSNIVKAKHISQQADQWTPEFEINFWESFNKLATRVNPVTLESIRASSNGNTAANKCMKRYRALTFIFLLFVLVIQIIWTYGTTTIDSIYSLSEQINSTSRKEAVTRSLGTNEKDGEEIDILSRDKDQYTAQLKACYIRLRKWSKRINHLFFIFDREGNMEVLQDSQFLMKILGLYLLPLLYGFLGSCMCILRAVITEIKDVTFIAEDRNIYVSRLLLGGLAGLAIGWFATPENASALKSISPFALAFLAGYGIELLYSIMDKIITFFSVGSTQKEGRA